MKQATDLPTEKREGDALLGWAWGALILTFIFPILAVIPFVLGIILAAKQRPGAGVGIMVLSVAVFLIRMVIWAQHGYA
jgi:hypothetical protein